MPEESKKVIAEVVEEIASHAPKKDVGMFLKMVGVAIFVLALGMTISIITRGWVSIDAKVDAKAGAGVYHSLPGSAGNSTDSVLKLPEPLEEKVIGPASENVND